MIIEENREFLMEFKITPPCAFDEKEYV